MGRIAGIEPATSWTTIRRSNLLSYIRQGLVIVPQSGLFKKIPLGLCTTFYFGEGMSKRKSCQKTSYFA